MSRGDLPRFEDETLRQRLRRCADAPLRARRAIALAQPQPFIWALQGLTERLQQAAEESAR